MKRIRSLIAIGLASSLILSARPVRSNPAALVAPAACSTGIGCILVGVAVFGGGAYYVWQNRKTERRHYMAITDPEEEARWMGGPHETEPVIAGTRKAAEERCRKLARGRILKEVRHFQKNIWDCVYY